MFVVFVPGTILQIALPDESSAAEWARFRKVPVCAGVGSGGKFRKAPESSDGHVSV